jgi:hypothetical protein
MERGPQRERGRGVAEVVYRVGKQGHASGERARGGLDNGGEAQANEGGAYGADAKLRGLDDPVAGQGRMVVGVAVVVIVRMIRHSNVSGRTLPCAGIDEKAARMKDVVVSLIIRI